MHRLSLCPIKYLSLFFPGLWSMLHSLPCHWQHSSRLLFFHPRYAFLTLMLCCQDCIESMLWWHQRLCQFHYTIAPQTCPLWRWLSCQKKYLGMVGCSFSLVQWTISTFIPARCSFKPFTGCCWPDTWHFQTHFLLPWQATHHLFCWLDTQTMWWTPGHLQIPFHKRWKFPSCGSCCCPRNSLFHFPCPTSLCAHKQICVWCHHNHLWGTENKPCSLVSRPSINDNRAWCLAQPWCKSTTSLHSLQATLKQLHCHPDIPSYASIWSLCWLVCSQCTAHLLSYYASQS